MTISQYMELYALSLSREINTWSWGNSRCSFVISKAWKKKCRNKHVLKLESVQRYQTCKVSMENTNPPSLSIPRDLNTSLCFSSPLSLNASLRREIIVPGSEFKDSLNLRPECWKPAWRFQYLAQSHPIESVTDSRICWDLRIYCAWNSVLTWRKVDLFEMSALGILVHIWGRDSMSGS